MTKIVFMGTPAFSVPILEALIAHEEYEVVAVVTQPDRPVGRKKVLTPTPVKEAAVKQGIMVLQPEKISGSAEMQAIVELQPDLIVTAAFGQFLPQSLLDVPRLGAVNVHASLLPKYRGGAPIHYALINGETETGVTIMYMEKKMDAGDILGQRTLSITSKDDVGSLFERLSIVGRDLLLETLPHLIAGTIQPIKQDEALVTYSPNISREEEVVDWGKTATEIDWKVRGMRPWPVAYTMLQGNRLKIWDVTPMVDEKTIEKPGTIIALEKEAILVACGAGTVLRLNQIQPAGKGKLTAGEFLRGVGSQLTVGEMVGQDA
ncbi:methionyl-tRNA formyltransferase [Carnobacterium gallinarum]|uniref:methionyl-tRNA formyltransferase n=1 Tax=Carnobacterium gallinarum TaxID=2749 RepID=UPI00054E0CC8|nr:methionyl-tRNA formyltransferase [Carnobacterium gallinarum]